MSETFTPFDDAVHGREASPGAGATAGTLIRQAREASGLHVAALAVSLKVPVRKLEALEADRHDLLTDAVFVRALASAVCRALKVNAQPILERLPASTAPRLLRDIDGINTPFRAPSDGAPPTWFDQLTRPVFLAVFALLIGALVLILLPSVKEEAPAPLAKKVEPQAALAQQSASESGITTVSLPVSEGVSQPLPGAAVEVTPALRLATSTSQAAPPASLAPAPAASDFLVLRAKGPSWIEVTDAKGAVALRKLLEAGETAGASGALPLQVTIGRADATEVQVRGKAFDLRPVSKDNVARFEVK
jgi:cytoskeleton protein RodZ